MHTQAVIFSKWCIGYRGALALCLRGVGVMSPLIARSLGTPLRVSSRMAAAEAPQRGETSSVVRVDSTAPFSHTVKLQLTEQTIHDASRGDRLLSPEFSGGGFRWAIMTLVGGDTSAPGHISVYLTLVSPNASIRAAFQMQIGNVTLKEVRPRTPLPPPVKLA